jgi:hypothetical protein
MTLEVAMLRHKLLITGSLTAVLLAPVAAPAQEDFPTINQPPQGAGTEAPTATPGRPRVREGIEAGAQLGTGFTDTYGLGFGARVGFTFGFGAYVGGSLTHYIGNSVETLTADESAHATFLGAEGGYKLFVAERWEIRPYLFLGPGFLTSVEQNPFFSESKTRLALQPGLLTAYHFGQFYVSLEGKAHVTPTPTALTVLAGAGLGI